MKILFIINILFLAAAGIRAQDNDVRYMEIMKKTIEMMDTTTSKKFLMQAANQFERIGNAIQNQWLPFYYCTYCYVQISHLEKSDKMKDLNVEKAEELISVADKLSANNSEIYVMKGFILQAKMNVDPMIRGPLYNKECLEMFEKARKIDPENPRSYLWEGVNLLNTPAFLGGGKNKALPLIEKAIEKYKTFKIQSDIHPNWGKEYAQMMLNKCKD
jgi:tetratricopeptide (TPR) repeat protein